MKDVSFSTDNAEVSAAHSDKSGRYVVILTTWFLHSIHLRTTCTLDTSVLLYAIAEKLAVQLGSDISKTLNSPSEHSPREKKKRKAEE